jgi:molybdate transport system substrate-binding protein
VVTVTAIALVLLVALTSCSPVAREREVTISAASDLMAAFAEVRDLFERRTQIRVRINFGSTGQLTQQIEQGAPVDLFAAADASFVDQLDRKGMIVPGTKALYGRGRLALWTRADSPLELRELKDLTQAEVKRIAIANPQHAPYGAAARQALESLELWSRIESRLVYAENIRQAFQYAETGNVDVGIVALSLCIGSTGKWVLVPEELHQPLNQTLAIIKGAHNEAAARQFVEFLSGDGRAIMARYGFLLPSEGTVR